ncbi:TonB-dependent receptor [Sphingomonas sp. LHG3406-1]|uniref:TonB-dependent receptor domain-containing protein n=1 Tax=Sphingomonas sp. LHG3406-1 TaxID=2804617 RepID=UPI00261EE853|nr:TonB-dependent receptor [Sphingomonas sp. LHG3406-1]
MRKTNLLGATALNSLVLLGASFVFSTGAAAQTAPAPAEQRCDDGTTVPVGQQCPVPSAPTTSAEQEQADAPAAAPDSDIVVTGSRIRRPNLDSSVPITSVSPSELSQRGEVSLGDALNDLPALRSTFSQANSTTSIGTAGLSLLDLRGLGTVRTLVLVNGRRHVTAQPGGTQVDVNTIPVDLLERVDVVTGGNSAVYGSDAVAGVVNFVLRRDFTGVRMRGQAGISQYGDRENVFGSIIAGHNLFDGRLNITAHAEYSNAKEVFYSDRSYLGAYTGPGGFYTSQSTGIPAATRNFDGIPNTQFWDIDNGDIPGIRFGNISTGGYIATACPAATATNAARVAALCTGQLTPTNTRIARNYSFLPDGTLAPDVPFFDNRPLGGGVFGGLSATGLEDAMLLPGLERVVGNIFINGDVSPAFQPFVEAKFARINATQQSTQPTFVASTLNPTFSVNNPFLTQQARDQLAIITNGGSTFNMLRFNNDLGTRAEDHRRDTYRFVAGVRGDVSSTGNLRYELAFNYGKTKTYYETGGNVIVANFNRATNAVRDSVSGQIVCFVNSSQDTVTVGGVTSINTANNDPNCAPLNLFGRGNASQAAKDYVLYTSTRREQATQLNVVGFVSGDTEGLFELPGGPIGFAVGGEYRRERARSVYDERTRAGETFLNAFQPFLPPTQTIKEGFAELRLPLVKDVTLLQELTVEGAFRRSKYNTFGNVDAYNAGVLWSPVRGIRARAGYGRSVRAPNLSNLFQSQVETFANGLQDPCDQNFIANNPARAANCAAAGIPTTITYQDSSGVTITRPWTNVPGSGVSGVNRGNPDLRPETGDSYTVGVVFEPPFLPGFALTIDYYDIKVKNVISGLTGQQILNRCYDDPTGIDNEFCSAIFRRSTSDPITNGTFLGQTSRRLDGRAEDVFARAGNGISFINQPYNFAALVRSGVDFDASYRRRVFGNKSLSLRGIVSYLGKSENFSYLTQPNRSDKIDETLGDPKWAASWNAGFDLGTIDLSYSGTYVGRQSILAWETQFTHQGRGPTNPDARPFRWYPAGITHSGRVNFEVNKNYRFYVGVDNITNERPPFDLTGLEAGSPYGPTGRYFYAGAGLNF